MRTAFGGYTPESTVTGWEPLHRFAQAAQSRADLVQRERETAAQIERSARVV